MCNIHITYSSTGSILVTLWKINGWPLPQEISSYRYFWCLAKPHVGNSGEIFWFGNFSSEETLFSMTFWENFWLIKKRFQCWNHRWSCCTLRAFVRPARRGRTSQPLGMWKRMVPWPARQCRWCPNQILGQFLSFFFFVAKSWDKRCRFSFFGCWEYGLVMVRYLESSGGNP